ncbi:hypothetical protein B7H23_07360 [Notoacmeibacter marinus]|uniref:Tetrameric acyl-CoA thioesterase n=1 Tax=Notoacmeibacter marinus TaxID=1876515 RepID=A0A231V3F8_9HYPH|nr:DUF4442 domain-containing protein [Notoacmeibacter marinus]OXT02694.1 hypothetical protein B7H23_07360 [Notoacmeibacter marinus]
MKPSTLRRGMNFWPPYFFAGIRVTYIAEDWRRVDVELRQRRLNMNYVGVHFGGSIFSMTDPFFMLMAMNILPRDYTVWDKAAFIDFKKPGKGTLRASFRVTDTMIEEIEAATPNEGDVVRPVWSVVVEDGEGDIVAKVDKTLHIRRKADNRSRIGARK